MSSVVQVLALTALGMCLPGKLWALNVQDDEQQWLQLPQAAHRIVSLAPGSTAMLFAAGAGAYVVGTSAYSDEPPAATRVERIADAQSVDLERVLALHPDVVIVWSSGTSPLQIARLQRAGLRIYHHHVTRLEQIPDSLRRLGALAGTESSAQSAARDLASRIDNLRGRYPRRSATVLVQIWDRPLYTVGRDEIITDILHSCGFHSAYEDLAEMSPVVTIESVLARDPDIILALAADPASSAQWLRQWQVFDSLKARNQGHLLAWSDTRLTALGPSVVDAAALLCEKLSATLASAPSR
jgi:iron complex transport system substrate-binding protein